MNAPQPASPAPSAPERPPRPPFWLRLLRPKVAIPLLLVLLAVAAVLGYRQSRLLGLPDVEDPFEPIVFDESVLLDEENAYADYLQARELRVPSDSPEATGIADPESLEAIRIEHEILDAHERVLAVGWSESTPRHRRWFEMNGERLRAYRHGAEKSRLLYPAEPSLHKNATVEMTEAAILGGLGSASHVTAVAWENLGKNHVSAAWDDLRAVLRTSRQFLPWDDIVDEYSSGAELLEEALPATEAWARHPRVDSDMLRSALQDVREADAIAGPPSETVRRGYAIYWHFLREHPFPQAYLDRAKEQGVRAAIQLFLQNEPEVSLRCGRLWGTNIREFVDREPWYLPPLTRPMHDGVELFEWPKGSSPPPLISSSDLALRSNDSQFAYPMMRYVGGGFGSHYPLTMSIASLEKILKTRRSDRARMRLVEALLCAEILRRETGRYPVRIEDLVRPELLSEVPRDPWSPTGAPLRYRVGDDGVLTIWSLGENQTDDDGHIHRNVEKSNDIAVTSRPREVPLPRFGSTPDPMPADPPSDPAP